MVIAVEKKNLVSKVQILKKAVYISLYANALGKGIHLVSKKERSDSLALVQQQI